MRNKCHKLGSWAIEIFRLDNGFVVLDYSESGQEGGIVSRICFEIKNESQDAHLDAFQKLVYYLMEVFGINTDRYARRWLNFVIEHGGKFECNERNCEICGGVQDVLEDRATDNFGTNVNNNTDYTDMSGTGLLFRSEENSSGSEA